MKNALKLFGIIVFATLIGVSFIACAKDALDGTTWKSEVERGDPFVGVLKFNSPNCTMTFEGETVTVKGSYSISGIDVKIAFELGDGGVIELTGTLTGNVMSLVTGGSLADAGETMRLTKQ